MYIGLGQIVGGFNPCGPGYDFLNHQCVHDPNCDFSGGSGIGVCPDNYRTVAVGTAEHPASDAEYQLALAGALAASKIAPAAPVAAAPIAAGSSPASSASFSADSSPLIPTWLLVAGVLGVGIWLLSRA